MLSLIKNSSFIQNLIRKEVDTLYNAKLKEDEERRLEYATNIAKESVGEPVIIVPDSDLTISVGIIVGYKQADPFLPIVEDYISEKKIVCFANYVAYNEQNLKAIMKLTPDERGGVFYRCNYTGEEGYKASKRGEKVLSYDEIAQVIHSTDFLKRAREYWAKYPFP